MRVRKALEVAMVLAGLRAPLAGAAEMTLCADVPSDLGGRLWRTTETFRTDGAGSYQPGIDLGGALGGAAGVDGLHVLGTDDMLFSADCPFSVGATDFSPSDVVRYQAGTYVLYQSGASLGLPEDSNVDGVALDSAGNLLLSFDTPITLSGTTFQPADVARVVGGVVQATPAFLGSSAGLGSSINTADFHEDGGTFYLLFSTPVPVNGADVPPGTIVRYDPTNGLQPYWQEPALGRGNAFTGLSFDSPPSGVPGPTPDGAMVPGTPLHLRKRLGGALGLSWGPSCAAPADYAVYEGAIGSWTSHVPKLCSTGGALTAGVTPSAGSCYYIIVPRNAQLEGSYGFRSDGSWRPVSPTPCLPEQMVRMCP